MNGIKKKIVLFIIAIVVVAGTITYLSSRKVIMLPQDDVQWVNTKSDLIAVEGISAGQKISSPLIIRGSARGYWFFEASFPVEIEDESGDVLGRSIATADGEWMTEEFVPFTTEIEFDPKGATRGYLMLKKDNPSGFPENDDELKIPVTF